MLLLFMNDGAETTSFLDHFGPSAFNKFGFGFDRRQSSMFWTFHAHVRHATKL